MATATEVIKKRRAAIIVALLVVVALAILVRAVIVVNENEQKNLDTIKNACPTYYPTYPHCR